MPDEVVLNEAAYAVWKALAADGPLEVSELVASTGIDQAQITATATQAAEQGHIEITERSREELIPSDTSAALLESDLPEVRAALQVAEAGGELALPDFIAWAKQNAIAPNEVFKWGPARGWLERTKGEGGAMLVLTEAGKTAVASESKDDDVQALELAGKGKLTFLDETTQGNRCHTRFTAAQQKVRACQDQETNRAFVAVDGCRNTGT